MDKNTESNIINIPKGIPDWDKPLMKNLHILEGMIKDIENVEGLEDIKEDLKDLSRKVSEIERKHNIDLENVNIKITKIERNLLKLEEKIDNIPTIDIEDIENEIKNINQKNTEQDETIESQNKKILNNSQLIEENTKNINNSKESIEENSNNIEDIKKRTIANKNDIDNLSSDLDEKISDVQINIDENKDNINKNKESVNNNTKKIDEIKLSILKLNEDIKQMDKDIEEGLELLSNYHFIVSTTAEMSDLENVQNKSLCYVRKTGELFIYDGQWKVISTGEGGEISLEWNKIIGKPTSTPEYINASVRNSHRHENMFVLDKITESKITEWNGKANKSDIPTKTSQLINDSGYVDDSKLNQSIQKLDNEINRLDKEKANKIDVPNKVSQLENDKGYITEEDVDLTEVNVDIKELQDNKANKVHNHSSNDISVDDKTLTETLKTINNTLDNKANNNELKTKLSEFENDTKFTTLDEVSKSDTIKNINIELAKKVDKSEKGKADGVVPLNKDSKIALEYLPDLSKQQTHIIETVEDMQKLEKLLAGDKAFVVSSSDSYIWSGVEWKVLSKAEWENINLDWANIINSPLTSDDLVNISQIPTKADKNDIPSKISQLEDDKNITKDIQVLKDTKVTKTEFDSVIGDLETLTTEEKGELVDSINEVNKSVADTNKELSKKVDKVTGKQLSTNDYTTAEKTEVAKVKNKADKTSLNEVKEDISNNRSKWEKDTIYDDSGIKNGLKTKADKTEILSIFTQENEPKTMKIGDQWHQIVNN